MITLPQPVRVRPATVSAPVGLSLSAASVTAHGAAIYPATVASVGGVSPLRRATVGANLVRRVTISANLVPFLANAVTQQQCLALPAITTARASLSALAGVFAPLAERARRARSVPSKHAVAPTPVSNASVDDFALVDEVEGSPPSPPVEPLQTSSPQLAQPDTLVEELAAALHDFNGTESLRRIFFDVLGYAPVERRVRITSRNALLRDRVSRVEVLAEAGDIRVLRVSLKVGTTRRQRAEIVTRLSTRFSGALLVLASPSCSRVWLGWTGTGATADFELLRLWPFKGTAESVACRLESLRTFEPDGSERERADLARELDDLFDRIEPQDENPERDAVLPVEELFYRDLGDVEQMGQGETRNILNQIDRMPEEARTDTNTVYLELRNRLVTGHWRLAAHIVNHSGELRRLRSLTREDLIQAATEGLCEAIRGWNASFQTQFATYAWHWIQQRVQLAFQNADSMIRVPVHMHDTLRSCWGIAEGLYEQLGREPRPREVADDASEDGDGRDCVAAAWQALAFAPVTGHAGQACPCSSLAARTEERMVTDRHENETAQAHQQRLRSHIARAFEEAQLDDRERHILELHHGIWMPNRPTAREIGIRLGLTSEATECIEHEGLTLRQIQLLYGVTYQRVQQIEADALAQLRQRYESGGCLEHLDL